MTKNINLNWLRTFEAAARHLGFTAASLELGLTQTAVSQHIKALELKLGHDLFVRRAKSVTLTDIGEAYLPSIREGLQTINLSTRGLFGPDLASSVVIRASMACIVWLSSKLEDLQQQHPKIGVKFVTSIWPETSNKQLVDIDVILAPPKHAGHHLVKLSDEYIVPICGPETSGLVSNASDLTQLNPIHILGFDDHWARYLGAYGVIHDMTSTRLIVDTSVAACEMVAAERGCAILIERFAVQAIQSNRPIKIVGARVPLGQSHFVSLQETSQQQLPEVEAVVSWLHDCFTS